MLLPSKVVAWHCIRMCRHITNYAAVLKSECSSCLNPVSLWGQSWTLYRVQCGLHLLHLAVELSRLMMLKLGGPGLESPDEPLYQLQPLPQPLFSRETYRL